MERLKNYIYKQVASHELSQAEAKQMLLELKDKTQPGDDEIAVIGMSGRFPGSKTLSEYWENIRSGKICIGELPKNRVKDIEDYLLKFHYQQLVNENAIKEDGHLDLKYDIRGYLDDIDKFDAAFFGIPPREARAMDPDQRMFLEVAYEAIEDAGYCGDNVYGTGTGVFVGIDHVSELKYKQLAASDPMVVTGTWPGILASRISYIFNFHGPSMVIDTACSSGLVSVHTACNSLKNGECELAIAGGLSGFNYRPLDFKDELKELDSVEAKDNTVKSFDKKANGAVWGEGVGAVLLKPLKKALNDGDSIYAVIKSSDINNDGASNGITAPDAGAQERLLVAAWKKAGINPETVGYIEAHGTGTVLGDPIEVKAMTNAFRGFTEKKQFCGIGSVKTSIGHLVGASGIASLIKVILMLKNKRIPASLNFTEPNPYINFCDSPVYVSDKLSEWEAGETPRRAGINAFGFSGTNCHVVVEEAPQIEVTDLQKTEFEILTISAKNRKVLKEMIEVYQKNFSSYGTNLQNLCYTANTGRGQYNCRLAMLVRDLEDLKSKLDYLAETDFNELNKFGVYFNEHKIAPDNKTVREKGEITEAERRKLTRTASAKLDELVQNYSYPYAAELCELYVKGAKVEWNELYKGQKRRRLNLPVYLLERTRYWYEEKNPAVQTSRETAAAKIKEISHPLVDRCLVESLYHDVYTTIFRADRQWVLKDHKILESHVIPGTTYIEMAIEVCKKYYGSQMEIKDIIYFSPVIVEENEEREVHSILFKCKDHIEVTFASRINTGDINEQWIKHVECKVYKSADTQGRVFDIEKIKENLMSPSGEEQLIHMEQKEVGVELGERWQNEKIVAVGRSEALVVLELPEHIAYDQSQFCLHVSMLDNAVNAISQKIGQGLYLPFFYKSIKVTGKMSSKVYSYIRVKGKPHKEAETVTFDVSLMDSLGRVFAEVSDYSIKKVNETEYRQREIALKSNVYFDLGWIENEPSGNMKDLKDANILIFADRNGIADGLPEKLEAEGCSVIEVKIGNKFEKVSENEYSIAGEEEDYKLLFGELADRKLTHILHLMTISGGKEANSLEKLEEKQKLGIYSLLYMTKALVAAKFSKEIDIVLVSDYANDVTKTEKQLDPANGAFLGMGKTITLEHSNLRCSCIDLDESNSIDSILKELKTAEKTSKVAYRNGKRFVEELRKLELDKSADNKLTIRENGVYLITGGAGGLGLEMGKLLAAKNKVKIALVNRSQVPARKLWDEILDKAADKKLCRTITAIREIERLGSQVSCFSADVSNHEEMQSVMNLIKLESGPVNGIIHCAGVAGDGFMMRKDKKTFDSVVSPKVTGTWILDQLTCKDTIDFFVMFSSILSIFGDPGQGDYTAANAYMDVFAAYRQRQGKKTIAINWPAWKDTGMAVDYHIREEDTVVKPVSTQKAIRAFEEILESQSCRVLPGDLNYLKLSDIRDDLQFRLSSQIQDVLDKHKAKAKVENEGAVTSERDEKALIKGRGSDDYNETENKLAQIWSQVLGLNEIDIFDSFSSLGGDSMMAIQLLKEITKVFKDTIDITDIFTHPSVQQMSEYIDEKLGNRKDGKKTAKANEAEISDNSLKSMLDGLESGETSIENVMKMLGSN